MMCPRTLPDDVKARAFRAANGELGIDPADTHSFIDACRADGVEILGWELWIIDHIWGENGELLSAPESWSGGIAILSGDAPAIIGGTGDADETQQQLKSLNLEAVVQPRWLDHIRVNFTLAD